ncbi:glycosyltransferase family 2 protein [Thiococcus pfennigii]|uniref:glycosyltransferase family 2 protein n=1 Tax=Thiococcus pfennigii TaxID=1057 RepID=UPI001907BFD2|nr:glycosyltransferase family 2 protein [Thiococcus pfennigii]MBK1699962.1 glycosyl transferase [Thiococcus pfennigii]
MTSPMTPTVSVVIVSFNTRELLAECLTTLAARAGTVSYEVIVVDNASRDGSADLVAERFPEAVLIRSERNLGFAAANNLGFAAARGRFLVLLNSDAFLEPQALERAVAHMEANPRAGLGGARLIGRDGAWQPAARRFPSPLREFLTLSGLAARYPRSRFFGQLDRTWADPLAPAAVDWVPGAFAILPRDLIARIGAFDEAFFLYYEEVDLCRRIRAAGLEVWYWPDVVVVHIGGESSRTQTHLEMSAAGKGAQLTLWRMRSELLYYRKHHGWLGAWAVRQIETRWHQLRAWRNGGEDPPRRAKRAESTAIVELMARAWRDTDGGRTSPPRPW